MEETLHQAINEVAPLLFAAYLLGSAGSLFYWS